MLGTDGRISNKVLATEVGLSQSACSARVRRLEERGIIQGYRAQIALEEPANRTVLFAQVSLRDHHPQSFARFEKAAAKVAEIAEVHSVSGDFDYLLRVETRGPAAWSALSDSLLENDLGIERISSYFLMKTVAPRR